MGTLADPGLRHLFVLAHYDDEVGYGGLLRRLAATADTVYVTNGDGPAPELGRDPVEYARLRAEEGRASLAVAGVAPDRIRFLGHSEIEIYDRLLDVTARPGDLPATMAFFRAIADEIALEVERVQPDVIWTCAYQQGHPEHDLVHAMTAAARRRRPAATLCALPQYELTILVPLRFAPWFRLPIETIALDAEEVAAKRDMRDAHASQARLMQQFERVIGALGVLARLTGRGFTFEEFAARETFAAMPPDYDYLRSTHPLEALNYVMERHRGVKVRFDRHVRPVVTALLRD